MSITHPQTQADVCLPPVSRTATGRCTVWGARSLLMLLALAFAVGCARTPLSTFYQLGASEAGGDSRARGLDASSSTPLIGVRAVRIPAYLDRPQIVIRSDAMRVERREFERWAEPLEDMLETCLVARLSTELPDAFVLAFPWSSLQNPKFEVSVDIRQLDGQPGGKVFLQADWRIFSPVDKKMRIVYQAKTALEKPCSGNDTEAFVHTTEAVVNELGTVIATKIKQLRSQ